MAPRKLERVLPGSAATVVARTDPKRAMPELGALFLSTQAMATPGELINLALNAGAVAPEGAVLIAMLATLLVDLAGERVAVRWVPPICYLGLGTSLVLLALQWNAPLEPSFLGAFLSDRLAIAFRAIIALSTLLSLLISWRYAEKSGTPVGEYAAILLAATLGAMLL
jgi:NAD(P)H-quinone oxidoreductase subunit 2